MNTLLLSLWFTTTAISVTAMTVIAFYIWINYARVQSDAKGFFVCLVLYKAAACLEQICAYAGLYGVSPNCFTAKGLAIRLLGRLVEVVVALGTIRYLIMRQK